MTKITYVATFPGGGTLTRNSKAGREYTHAWRVLDVNGNVYASGFSSHERLALNAAANCARGRRGYTSQVAPTVVQAPDAAPGVKPWRIRKTLSYLVGTERREHTCWVNGQANKHLRFASFEEADKFALRCAISERVVKNETTSYAAVCDPIKATRAKRSK